MNYGKPLTAKQLDGLIDKLNAANDAQQTFIDSHCGGDIDPETEALYEATYELVSRLQDIVRFHLAPQVEGLIDMSTAYQSVTAEHDWECLNCHTINVGDGPCCDCHTER